MASSMGSWKKGKVNMDLAIVEFMKHNPWEGSATDTNCEKSPLCKKRKS